MSQIQQVNSAPSYISDFIQNNMEKLMDIHEEGVNVHTSGCMMFVCSKETNKMDVQFMSDEMMCGIIQEESWFNLKNNIPEHKKLFFVRDEDLNSVFLIYI